MTKKIFALLFDTSALSRMVFLRHLSSLPDFQFVPVKEEEEFIPSFLENKPKIVILNFFSNTEKSFRIANELEKIPISFTPIAIIPQDLNNDPRFREISRSLRFSKPITCPSGDLQELRRIGNLLKDALSPLLSLHSHQTDTKLEGILKPSSTPKVESSTPKERVFSPTTAPKRPPLAKSPAQSLEKVKRLHNQLSQILDDGKAQDGIREGGSKTRGFSQKPISLLAIGISTGGPKVLRDILPLFPVDFPLPIVIVQHMLAGFTNDFAKGLDAVSDLDVFEVAGEHLLKAGEIVIASGDAHLSLKSSSTKDSLKLISRGTKKQNSHCPSVGVLFDSIVSANLADRTLAIIMTGMGSDGSREIGKIRNAGGYTIAQDEKSCTVFGMPRVAIEEENIDEIVTLDQIVKRAKEIVKTRGRSVSS